MDDAAHQPRVRQCARCRKSYVARSGNSLYCGTTCSNAAREAKRAARRADPTILARPRRMAGVNSIQADIRRALLSGPMHRTTIIAATGHTGSQVSSGLVTLQRDGVIESVERGVWKLTGS